MSDDVDGENSVMKTCCCCMDVRLGTIVLGFCHLVSNREIAMLSFSVFSSDVCNESCKLMPAFQTLVLIASCDLFYSKFSFRTVSRRIRQLRIILPDEDTFSNLLLLTNIYFGNELFLFISFIIRFLKVNQKPVDERNQKLRTL